jgi:FkbM family methyltransferase
VGFRAKIATYLRDRAGPRTAPLARAIHTAGIYGLGHGTAELSVERSGERQPLALLTSPATIFDVGAHTGDYAVMAARILEEPTIHCFEPNPSAFRSRQAVGIWHELALGASPGLRELYQDPSKPTMASLHPGAVRVVGLDARLKVKVATTTLDEFCSEHGIERIDLLKIDVEGAEFEVLRGGLGLLEHGAIGIVQFEFGYANLASRTFMRDFYDLLGETHSLHRVTPGGLVPLGDYRLEVEVFASATNYAAIPR